MNNGVTGTDPVNDMQLTINEFIREYNSSGNCRDFVMKVQDILDKINSQRKGFLKEMTQQAETITSLHKELTKYKEIYE
jgi:hypothetical protein